MNQFFVFLALFALLFLVNLGWNTAFDKLKSTRDLSHPDYQESRKEFIMSIGRRLDVAWVFMALIALAFCFGYVGITVFFFVISFLALREFVSVMNLKASDYWPVFCSFYIFLPLQYIFVLFDVPFLFYIFIPVYVFLISPMLCLGNGDTEQFFERASKFQWAQISAIYCISYLPAIAGLELLGGAYESSALLLFFLVVLFASDIAQYVFGSFFGKKLVAPTLSPNKTWEPMVAGIVLASVIGIILSWLTPFTAIQAFFISLLVASFGTLGKLVMSAIKRSLKIKDWSDTLGVQGGILDRFSSLLFAAPLFYHLCRYYFS